MGTREDTMMITLAIDIILLLSVSLSLQVPTCQDERVTFIAQPANVEIGCEIGDVAIFFCLYAGSSARPQWIINSTVYTSINSLLPPDHTYVDHKLYVGSGIRNNNTIYQCQLLTWTSNEGSLCAYKSTEGRLIARCFQALDVNYTLHYQFNQSLSADYLTGISITFVQPDGYENSTFNSTLSDSLSGKQCASDVIQPSSCVNGICRHHFYVSSLLPCFLSSTINLTVTSIHPDFHTKSGAMTIIDIGDKFVQVSFESLTMTVTFLDKPDLEEEKNFFTIKYAPMTKGCDDLPPRLTADANTVTLQLNDMENVSEPICFTVITRSNKKFVRVDGMYTSTLDLESDTSGNHSDAILNTPIIITMVWNLLFVFLWLVITTIICCTCYTPFKRKRKNKGY